LDAYNAYSVVKTLCDLAKKGRTIVFSIHQPRSNIFSQFDEIILLNHGEIAYAGPAEKAEDYFKNKGIKFPKNTNIADHLIDLLTQEDIENSNFENPDLDSIQSKIENDSSSLKEDNENIPLLKENEPVDDSVQPLLPFATSFINQFYYLSKRSFSNFYRNFFLFPSHFLSAIFVGLLLGTVSNNLI
jgi:ABC-type multidrug transport system ATPase subunit